MPDIAKAGDPRRLRSGWINGIKRLPVSYQPLTPSRTRASHPAHPANSSQFMASISATAPG